jgi:CarD family transcriptional regulator, regulator of rRNA transcription
MTLNTAFSSGDLVVYPSHGVGKLEKIEHQMIAGQELQVLVINFEKNRMTLSLPMVKAKNAGLRALSSAQEINDAYFLLKKRVKATKGIWARRAQEYETKINSGNLASLAEVLRELHRNEDQPEQSYSERQIYQNALERIATEVAAVEAIQFDEACEKIKSVLKAA